MATSEMERPPSTTPDWSERIELELEELVRRLERTAGESVIGTVHHGLLATGGKLLRPRVLLTCVAHGVETGGRPDWDRAREAALAVEIAHVGTLYHDDVVDRSWERRGVPSIHRRFGVRVAALAGAHLLALSNSLAANLPGRLHRLSTAAALRMAGGQLREMEQITSLDRSPAEYVRNASRKTGAIFEFAAVAGGVLGGAMETDREVLHEFGRHLGIAFQLFDDLQDFAELGEKRRAPANDLRERNYTLPVLIAAHGDAVGSEIRHLLRDDGRPLGEDAVAQVCALLAESGAFCEAAAWASRSRESARTALEKLSPSHARRLLFRLLDSLRAPEEIGAMVRQGREV
jgi:geranylgeranyl pyrophosphate synthase